MKLIQTLLFTLVFFSSVVLAQTSTPLRIATLDYPPYQYQENGVVKGIAADIVKEVFDRLKMPITITFYPFQRALANIQSGESDVIFTFYHKPEREEFAYYSQEALVNQTIALYVPQDSPISFDGDLSKLNGNSFGLVRFSYGKIFDDAIANKVISKVDYVTSMPLNIEKFLAKRYEILPGDRWVVGYYYSQLASAANEKTQLKIKELSPSIQTFPAFVGFSKKNNLENLRNDFDKTIKGMKTDGSYETIINKTVKSWNF